VITFAQIELGYGAAVSCRLCAAGAEPTMHPTSAVVAQIATTSAQWTTGPGPNVSFVGTEPFSHPQLPQLISSAVEAGCERIRLRTDGGALAAANNALGAFRAGVHHLELILLAGDSAGHDRLSGRAGLFDAAIAGLSEFAAAGRHCGEHAVITGLAPLCRHTAPGLPATISAFARAGAVSVLVVPGVSFEIPRAIAAQALRAATVSGVALHGPGVSPFSADPWCVLEVSGAS